MYPSAHVPPILTLLGALPEATTVYVLGFAELHMRITPERVGRCAGQLLVIANVSRHTHFARFFIVEDRNRISEGLQVIKLIDDSAQREQALDGLVRDLLGFGPAA